MRPQALDAVAKQLQAKGYAEYEIAAHDDKAGKHDERGRTYRIMRGPPAGLLIRP
jgi:hypothetical protein